MMRYVLVLFAGLIFGSGLVISGMRNPAKVLGFLDITGQWDASLAFVMASAVSVAAVGYRFVLRRGQPIFEKRFLIPTRTDIDLSLVSGAVLFGVGWGLVGLCPGPAIAALAIAPSASLMFFVAMLTGMFGGRYLSAALTKKTSTTG